MAETLWKNASSLFTILHDLLLKVPGRPVGSLGVVTIDIDLAQGRHSLVSRESGGAGAGAASTEWGSVEIVGGAGEARGRSSDGWLGDDRTGAAWMGSDWMGADWTSAGGTGGIGFDDRSI